MRLEILTVGHGRGKLTAETAPCSLSTWNIRSPHIENVGVVLQEVIDMDLEYREGKEMKKREKKAKGDKQWQMEVMKQGAGWWMGWVQRPFDHTNSLDQLTRTAGQR
jgi:hypothetical protein